MYVPEDDRGLGGGILSSEDWKLLTQIVMSAICGIIGAECRNALDVIRIGDPPRFHGLSAKDKKRLINENPFRYKHYLVGAVAAFVGVVTLASDLNIAHQAVIALISSLSGNSFLVQRMESGSEGTGDYYGYLEGAVKNLWESIAQNYSDLNDSAPAAAAQGNSKVISLENDESKGAL